MTVECTGKKANFQWGGGGGGGSNVKVNPTRGKKGFVFSDLLTILFFNASC